tara:strand:+ start:3439 stop:3609 length:171 start_codon:yes stop_codon:yes gene_type:complete
MNTKPTHAKEEKQASFLFLRRLSALGAARGLSARRTVGLAWVFVLVMLEIGMWTFC